MFRELSLRLSVFSAIALLVGIATCMFLAYFVLVLVQVVIFIYEILGAGGMGG